MSAARTFARSRWMILSVLLMAGLGARRGRAAPEPAKSAPAPAPAPAPASADSQSAPAAPLKSPPPFRWAGNPPRTVFLPSASNPLVAIRVLFRTGSVDDPKGKEGLATLTAEMIGKGGSRARSYAELLDALYPLAANIRVYGDKESVVFEGMVHRDNAEKFAELLAEQILNPRFAEDDFTRNRQDAVDYLTKTLRGNDDENLGKQAMASVLYAGHPYGYPSQGTVAGLQAITLPDVKLFYETHYTRDRLVVGVGGGYPAGFADAFTRRFSALGQRGVAQPRLPPPPRRDADEILIVEKDARANAISIGRALPITRASTDFYPLTVARSYLGEHRTFNGVLMNHLRSARGLNYGDYAYVENFIQDGWSTFPLPNIPRRQQHFEIWLRPVPPQNALFALRAALYETDKLIREGIPEAGFQATRTFLMNYADLWIQDISRRLGYAMDAQVTGKDLIKELHDRLPRMKKADVDRVIRKYLAIDKLSIAIVSDKGAEVRQKLVDAVATPITYDTAGTPPEILQEDKVIEKFALPVAPDKVRVVPVDQMFERASQ
ncbi:MAG TPA: pitrilysin family protein [Polyangia bacterium]|jgi:zinc protease|nr:pitrilysin family protein [Polyangia bacterium]